MALSDRDKSKIDEAILKYAEGNQWCEHVYRGILNLDLVAWESKELHDEAIAYTFDRAGRIRLRAEFVD